MFKNIAVSYDDSEASRFALMKAIEYSRAVSAELHVIIISDYETDSYNAIAVSNQIDDIRKARKNMLSKAVCLANEHDVRIRTHTVFGRYPDCLVSTLKDIDAQLLVIAQETHSNVLHWIRGDKTSRIVERCPVSVMVVKHEAVNRVMMPALTDAAC